MVLGIYGEGGMIDPFVATRVSLYVGCGVRLEEGDMMIHSSPLAIVVLSLVVFGCSPERESPVVPGATLIEDVAPDESAVPEHLALQPVSQAPAGRKSAPLGIENGEGRHSPGMLIPSADPEFDSPPPIPVIKSEQGDQVIPQTVMHLYGDESYVHNGTVAKWQWEVSQPIMSQSIFVPASNFPNPSFEVNVAGVYTFYLTVFDGLGTQSLHPAEFEVVVIPDQALHIELLWHTPEDPDETDTGPEAGSDLDLHFLHPFAAGPDLDGDGAPDGWFDIPFDCFWFNAHPNWGSFDPSSNDNADLDRDDTDGAGPENINLNIPENLTYKVGVHYWNDHGYGGAYATVRVYIYGKLVAEFSDVLLFENDMWEVATIEWPTGTVSMVPGDCPDVKVTPDYVNPYFYH